jgi:hypothetical protein
MKINDSWRMACEKTEVKILCPNTVKIKEKKKQFNLFCGEKIKKSL